MVSQWNSGGIIFPGCTTLQLCNKVHEFMSKLSDPSEFPGRIVFMSMFIGISWGSEDNERECNVHADFVSFFCKKILTRTVVISRTWIRKEVIFYSTFIDRPQGEWDRVAESTTARFGGSGHPVFRATSTLSRGTLKAKEVENYQYTSVPMEERLNCFRTIVSVNQLSIYGAVSDLCDEYKACHVRTGRLVMAGQSDPLFVPTISLMNTLAPSTEVLAQEGLLRRYQERVERLSQQNGVIQFCTEAGFLTTVDVGQYFMTKDTEKFSQFAESVACREYILPRDEKLSDPKAWIRGNTRIGPVLEVTTSHLQGKYGVEIVNKDKSHSWVRISHGLNTLVTNLKKQRARNLRNAVQGICVEIECTCFCEPIKGQSETTKTYFCLLIYKNCTYQ